MSPGLRNGINPPPTDRRQYHRGTGMIHLGPIGSVLGPQSGMEPRDRNSTSTSRGGRCRNRMPSGGRVTRGAAAGRTQPPNEVPVAGDGKIGDQPRRWRSFGEAGQARPRIRSGMGGTPSGRCWRLLGVRRACRFFAQPRGRGPAHPRSPCGGPQITPPPAGRRRRGWP